MDGCELLQISSRRACVDFKKIGLRFFAVIKPLILRLLA